MRRQKENKAENKQTFNKGKPARERQ